MKIAMWSGPRNLSTAMMYAFAARGDFAVWDEPFYAPYLQATGADHPMTPEILAAHETDPAKVAARCAAEPPDGAAHLYMKHMPHHMEPDFPMEWTGGCTHIHLIRHPARVIASYAAKRADLDMADIGFRQQIDIWEAYPGPVIDSHDIRRDPAAALATLCAEIGLQYSDGMLSWPAGPRPYDGVWAQHWYGAVHRSTGFAGAEGPLPDLPGHLQPLLDEALPLYRAMQGKALRL